MASQPPTTGTPVQGQQGPPPQQQQGQAGAGERPLNVRDALSYLDQVKVSLWACEGTDVDWSAVMALRSGNHQERRRVHVTPCLDKRQ